MAGSHAAGCSGLCIRGRMVAMYFVQAVAVDIIAVGVEVGASLIACMWGMRADAGVSGFTNWVKKVSYPFCLAVVVGCIYLNFRVWNAAP